MITGVPAEIRNHKSIKYKPETYPFRPKHLVKKKKKKKKSIVIPVTSRGGL
jgi:hypothetical protein